VKFPFSSIISVEPRTGEFLLFRRPEIPVTIRGRNGSATYLGLVDTGSDNTIFPASVANYLGIDIETTRQPEASIFGGQRLHLLTGEAILSLDSEEESATWNAPICFFDFSIQGEEMVILGQAGGSIFSNSSPRPLTARPVS